MDVFINQITDTQRRRTQWIKIQLVVIPKDCNIGAFAETKKNKLPPTMISSIYLQDPHNKNEIVEIFINIIFRENTEKINDTFQDLGEDFEPAQIRLMTANPDIETHGHWLETITDKTIFKVMLQIINNIYIRTQEGIKSVPKLFFIFNQHTFNQTTRTQECLSFKAL